MASLQEYSVQTVSKIADQFKAMEIPITEYKKVCAINCINGAFAYLKSVGKTLKDIDIVNFEISVQNAALLELNYASIPNELYFDLRGKSLIVKPQGAGNEKLVMRYGVGLKKDGLLSPWLVREGDDFSYPQHDGLKVTPPKWIQKSAFGKVLLVVYPAIRLDGNVEWLIASRDEVVTNLIAHIRNNTLHKFYKTNAKGEYEYDNYGHKIVDNEKRESFYKTLENRTLDDLLDDEALRPYINPTYISGGSREQMIIRKMKNNALKNYPRDYGNSYVKDAAESMIEDKDESLNVEEQTNEIIQDAKVVKEDPHNDSSIQDFDIPVEESNDSSPEQPLEEKEEPKVQESTENIGDYGF